MKEFDVFVKQLETQLEALGIIFLKQHAPKFPRTDSYTATFSWKALEQRGLTRLRANNLEETAKLVMNIIRKLGDEVMHVSTESEQHYAVYNAYVLVDCRDRCYLIDAPLRGRGP